ncbi:MAG: PilZ domain-containing protein, partial [Phycisphaerales bacterium]|nr:PilZ domain-containing protein [Phycisphaerales bacterium]
LSVRVKIVVEPASMSHRQGVRLQGVTGDISAGGSQILLPRPLQIGDVYLVSFDRTQLDIPPVYALCVRGRLVKSDAFEAGLRFLEPVTLPGTTNGDGGGAIV